MALAAVALWLAGAAADAWRSAADETLNGPVPATVIEVIDGDTLSVRARIWLDQDVSTRVRLAGIDAPELSGGCPRERDLAVRARAFVLARLAAPNGGGARVQLHDVRYGKFARRVVARVVTAGAEDLSQALLAAGLARPYDGGRRASWCE